MFQKKVHIELLRLLAIYFVIFNHTGNQGYLFFVKQVNSLLYFPYMGFSILCKVAVPIFFMISGALLLNRNETLKELFLKRILRMIIILVVTSVPYYVWLHSDEGMNISSFLSYIYSESATTALWYLYSYIGLLLMLPFLRKMVMNLSEKEYIYLFVGNIIFVGILPCVEFLLWNNGIKLNESFSVTLFTT